MTTSRKNKTKPNGSIMLLTVLSILVILSAGCSYDYQEKAVQRNDLLENGVFIQVPGPNPILKPGPEGSFDEFCIEASDAIKDQGIYYLFYHGFGKEYNYGTAEGTGYQLGVATSKNPLGPFTKYEGNPVLKVGLKGGWEDINVACAMILKEGTKKYYMWYSAKSSQTKRGVWDVGLATSSSPLGPWEKYEGNPVIRDFGYVGGVVKKEGKYYLYSAYPIGSTGTDYSPMALAISNSPEGPWVKYADNPVIEQGEWGEWDDGGFSEAEVLYQSGIFHMFYGGAKLFEPRRQTRESIGYAYSLDGYNWIKYGLNPVATREATPNIACFAEVHAIIELPFIYCYHTIRTRDPMLVGEDATYDGFTVDWESYLYEEMGVQVIATQKPFSLDMPVLNITSLAAGKSTSMDQSPPINLSNITRTALTAQCTYGKNAQKPIRIHVRSSFDGNIYDTTDLISFDNAFKRGQTVQKTFEINSNVRFIKVMVENLDGTKSVSDVTITATLGG